MQGLTEGNKTGSVEDIYEELTTGADLTLSVVNPTKPVHGETKEIPKGSQIKLLMRVTPPFPSGSKLYSGFWKDGETEYWVTLSEEDKNKKGESKTMEGGKRRKSRKTRSKSKRRHTRKN